MLRFRMLGVNNSSPSEMQCYRSAHSLFGKVVHECHYVHVKWKEQAQANISNHRTKVCTVQFLLRVHLHHIPIVYLIIFSRMIRRIQPASQIHVMTSSPSIKAFCVCVEGTLDILPLAGALPLPL